MVPDALGYVWVAGRGVFQRANIVRNGSRNPDPTDILVPDGFEVELVATDLNEPVHATFGARRRLLRHRGRLPNRLAAPNREGRHVVR